MPARQHMCKPALHTASQMTCMELSQHAVSPSRPRSYMRWSRRQSPGRAPPAAALSRETGTSAAQRRHERTRMSRMCMTIRCMCHAPGIELIIFSHYMRHLSKQARPCATRQCQTPGHMAWQSNSQSPSSNIGKASHRAYGFSEGQAGPWHCPVPAGPLGCTRLSGVEGQVLHYMRHTALTVLLNNASNPNLDASRRRSI